MKSTKRRRWVVVVVFFAFMLLHQSDRLLIGSMPDLIRETFGINRAQFGLVISGALLVGTVMYPLWGYLYDRFARAKLLALASLIWGATTWLSAIAPTYGTFLATRASTGIDDSSYPGLYSLISDYFGPSVRGKIYGLLQIAQPLGFMLGMILALMLGDEYGWQRVFYFTGALGIVLAVVIFFTVRDVPRGRAEPEMEDLEQVGVYRFDWNIAKGLFRKRSLLLLFAQGFVGVFPWQVITYFFIDYLMTERGYADDAIMLTMGSAILVLSLGYFLGGALGDYFFKRTPRGRLLVSMVGVLMGAIMLYFIPVDARGHVSVHSHRFGQCDIDCLRHHTARSSQHSAIGAVLHGEHRRSHRSRACRLHCRPLISFPGHSTDLHLGLDPGLHPVGNHRLSGPQRHSHIAQGDGRARRTSAPASGFEFARIIAWVDRHAV